MYVYILQSKICFGIQNLCCLIVFLTFKGLRISFFEFGKILPYPPRIRPSFSAPGQGVRQKNCPGFDSLKKILLGGCIQLELTET